MWNVLVVDDDSTNRKLLVEVLEGRANCDNAGGGKEAYEAFCRSFETKKLYDVILLDVAMPDIDGIEVLRKIREYEQQHGILLGQGTPIIMVTAHKTTFMSSFNQGCDDFILKPVDGVQLIDKIQTKIHAKD
jgi:CheY-like chemotaxis protein